jgi:hypothetical protein
MVKFTKNAADVDKITSIMPSIDQLVANIPPSANGGSKNGSKHIRITKNIF